MGRRATMLGLGFAVAFGAPAFAAARPTSHSSSHETAAQIAAGHWSALPPAPISGRENSAVTWTGSEMLIWGGDIVVPVSDHFSTNQFLADGAAYDPAAQTWRTLPAAPIAARSNAASVWTGKQLFVWGGTVGLGVATNDGALFDPKTNAWQTLPPSPLEARRSPQAFWTGREVLVVNGTPAIQGNTNRVFLDAASYDLTTKTWRVLPAMPTVAGNEVTNTVSVWAGTQLLVWSFWTHVEVLSPSSAHYTSGVDLVAYRARTDRWRAIPDSVGTQVFSEAFWTGKDVILPARQGSQCATCGGGPGVGLQGMRYHPSTNTAQLIAHGPVDDTAGGSIWTGAALLRLNTSSLSVSRGVLVAPGDGAAWGPRHDTWTSLPRAPSVPTYPAAVWTGTELLLWGTNPDRSSPDTAVGLSLGA